MNKKEVAFYVQNATSLKFTEKISINGSQFLLKKRTLIFAMDGIQPAECEFYLI